MKSLALIKNILSQKNSPVVAPKKTFDAIQSTYHLVTKNSSSIRTRNFVSETEPKHPLTNVNRTLSNFKAQTEQDIRILNARIDTQHSNTDKLMLAGGGFTIFTAYMYRQFSRKIDQLKIQHTEPSQSESSAPTIHR